MFGQQRKEPMNSMFYGSRPGGHIPESHRQEAPLQPAFQNASIGASDLATNSLRMLQTIRQEMKEQMGNLQQQVTGLKENISVLNTKVEEVKSNRITGHNSVMSI